MNRARKGLKCVVIPVALLAILAMPSKAQSQGGQRYATYESFTELMAGSNAQDPKLVRISEPGPK